MQICYLKSRDIPGSMSEKIMHIPFVDKGVRLHRHRALGFKLKAVLFDKSGTVVITCDRTTLIKSACSVCKRHMVDAVNYT